MIRKLRVSVDGKAYDVTVEMDYEGDASTAAPTFGPPVTAASAQIVVAPPPPSPAAPQVVPAGPGAVVSPLAGRVTAIPVEAGQEVKEGDHLLTLEAMKMNTFVVAPRAGRVTEIKATIGAAIEEGQVLIVLD